MTSARNPNGSAGGAAVLANRYRLETRVAAGGMGEVWRATDLLLERTVAVKLLRESLAEDLVVSERFRREALMAARLSHPNMADVYDYVQEDGRPGIVMEYVEGETLADRIGRDGALEVADSVRIAVALLAALDQAHNAGIIHRDMKPGNVMLSQTGEVKVTDFGIARSVGHETLTETGMVVGTAHYLSPEQVNGTQATPSSDLYSVGAILYEMLTGAKPFQAETPLAVAMQRLTEDPAPPRTHRPDVPEPISQVVLRALTRDPKHRFASADGMRSALESALGSAQPSTVPQRMDPTPTMKLPAIDDPDAPTQVVRAEPATPAALTGLSPAAAVAKRRKLEYKRGLAWALLLATGAGLAVWLILALGSSGPVTVPDFKGMQLSEAKAKAADLGLVLVVHPRASEEPKDEVLAQDIAARARVEKGQTVVLSVSNGRPPCCEVPSLRGRFESSAREAITDAGLIVGRVSYLQIDGVDKGIVINQSPDAGETKPPGTEVDIVVADEPGGKGGKKNGKGNND